MTFCKVSFAIVLILACAMNGAAQDKGYWRAASNTASSITGDIALSDTRVTINFSGFVMAQIRALNSAEVAAAFDADASAGGNGSLYRLKIPADKRFLHKNTLCGSEETQWMATYVTGRNLKVAFFSGDNTPVLTMDSLANSSDLCGTFTYAR
jgi:hypothetical protein